jgi:uncharacterized membrane protein YraQ (UPF0718 family)
VERKNRKRREKLGDLCFELAKYILTAIVIAGFIDRQIKVSVFLLAILLSVFLLFTGYFLFPLDTTEADND